MAKAGAKTRVVSNAKRLKVLKIIILAANVGSYCEKFPWLSITLPFLAVNLDTYEMPAAQCDHACMQVLHVSVKLILYRQSSSMWSWLGFAATSVIYIVCYFSLAGMAGVTPSPSTGMQTCDFI